MKGLSIRGLFVFFVFLFLIFVTYFVFNDYKLTPPNLSGFSMYDIREMANLRSDYTLLTIIGVWAFFALVMIGVYIRDKVSIRKEIKAITKSMNYGEYQTDLDVLYDILKERKKLKIKVISDVFEINYDMAMNWAKILESGKLVSIEYPGVFGTPEAVYKDVIKKEDGKN